ncbi:hypothetical protein [Pseudoxanthomonas sp.]|uniref:hypothetical protein n=1 Tax=Pseudoxanthomonas sp. TaxID=1871049 RepID=UPI00261E4122|nr:hypothetical protein [Pseudoxanthomonas sp.]WDS36252.1 MAG: hypothetical protein O8I58_18605 [Pseudoxanthomonas sp.]
MAAENETAVQFLYRETGDDKWLDPSYARRHVGPGMAAWWRRKERAESQRAELKLRRADPLMVYLKRMLCSARKNAARKGLSCTISDEDIWTLLNRSARACEVTNVPFALDRHAAGRSPLAPSMDRLDDSKGYSLENVRLVCQIANLAMNVWDDRTLLDFISQARVTPL